MDNIYKGSAITSIGFSESNPSDTLSEAENKYMAILADTSANFAPTEMIGEGGQLACYKSDKYPDLVLKRLITTRRLRGHLTYEDYFHKLEEEHYVILGYYGYKFVPDTEFITLDSNSNLPDDKSMFVGNKDYVMLQEKVEGISRNDYFDDETYINQLAKSDKLPVIIENAKEFLNCYRRMLDETGTSIEEQFFINPKTGEIKIYDTNHIKTIEGFAYPHLRALGIDTSGIENGLDIAKALSNKYPEFNKFFSNASYEEIIRRATVRSPEREQLINSLQKYGEDDLSAFYPLLFDIMQFSPPGEPNRFVLQFQKLIDILTNQSLSINSILK